MSGGQKRTFLIDSELRQIELPKGQGIEYCGAEDGEEKCIGCDRNVNILIPGQCPLKVGELAIQPEFRRK